MNSATWAKPRAGTVHGVTRAALVAAYTEADGAADAAALAALKSNLGVPLFEQIKAKAEAGGVTSEMRRAAYARTTRMLRAYGRMARGRGGPSGRRSHARPSIMRPRTRVGHGSPRTANAPPSDDPDPSDPAGPLPLHKVERLRERALAGLIVVVAALALVAR